MSMGKEAWPREGHKTAAEEVQELVRTVADLQEEVKSLKAEMAQIKKNVEGKKD
jgi:hypothetical protein